MSENERLAEMDGLADVMATLAVLEPAAGEEPMPASQALASIKQRAQRTRPRFWDIISKEIMSMFKRKYAFATLLVVLVLGGAIAIPSVRAAASEFLGLFRVQKFAPISISPRQLAMLENLAEQGLTPGTLEMVSEPAYQQQAASMAEAASLTGAATLAPHVLGEPDAIYVTGAAQGRLTVDLNSSRAIMRAAGVDPALLPDSLEGAVVDVTIYPMVAANWTDAQISLMQSDSPLVDYPDDVNPVVLGEALLQLLGMTETEASRLAASIDWTNTLLFPVPENAATFSEVTVQGSSGLALSSLDGTHTALMWQKDGRVFILEGTETVRSLVRIANSLR